MNVNETGAEMTGFRDKLWPIPWSGPPRARNILLIPQHVNTMTQPANRAWEAALAIVLGVCAIALRQSRVPTLPSMPAVVRTDPFAVAWTSVRLRRPTVPDAAWAVLGGAVTACLIGGPLAIPAALFGAIGTLVGLARQRAKAGMRQKTRACAQVPPLADLFAAALAAGMQPADAALTVAHAFGGESMVESTTGLPNAVCPPAGRGTRREIEGTAVAKRSRGQEREALADVDLLACRFRDAATALRAGTDEDAAWSALAEDEATAPLAAAVIRAGRTGAPAAATVGRAARELREAASAALLAEVRAVGVRATAPLAICFLPAFVLLGVLPTAFGLLSRVHA
ncbi:type II secretion system F family protein [Actinospica durhamensis]|uniref:Type II secretion system F family protein n=1 Tax=Actinospica durhamensis TaxID=1508375 RepID=A0A941IR05_9ACTN|nr:type II secretion system F family protein [Actinospica durhamensis]MBR7838290.1 type II secretion system F family protein [Actinospica durhamensis]